MQTDNTLRKCQNDIMDELINESVRGVFEKLLLDTFDERIKDIIIKDNESEKKSHKTIIKGSTPAEIVSNIAVDELYNIISNNVSVAKDVANYLNKNGVNLSFEELKKHIGKIRKVRNFCNHKSEENTLKTAVQGAQKIKQIRDFMNNFKIIYKDLYDAYSSREALILDYLRGYAEERNENIASFQDVFRQSGMIDMADFAKELCDDELGGSNPLIVENLVHKAVFSLNIVNSGMRFARSQEAIVRRFILSHSEELKLSVEAKEAFEQVVVEEETLAQELAKRVWFYDGMDLIEEGDLLKLVNDNNIFLDYRCFISQAYIEFLENKIIPLMDKDAYFFVTEGINNFNQYHFGKGNDVYDRFITAYGARITAFAGIDSDENKNYAAIINKNANYNFLLLTEDKDIKSYFEGEPFNGTVICSILEQKKVEAPFVEAPTKGTSSVEVKPVVENRKTTNAEVKDETNQKPLFEKKEVDPYLKDEALNVAKIAGEGDVLVDKNGAPVKLLDKIGYGGEGDVYDCSREGLVAKIYSPKANTRNRKEKIELMTSRAVQFKGLCWPTDTLYNGNGQFVGFLMPKVTGVNYNRLVANIGRAMEKRGWDRKTLVICLINIMKIFEYLHKNNIIVGDINGANIMIEDYDKVYLVDTDSFQLDKYPCTVENQIFVDPTLRLNDGEKHAYTIEEDQYKLAIIAYNMIMTGQMPYQINEGDPGGVFRFTEKGARVTAKSVYTYIWSNMERSVQKLFLRVFDRDERNITASQWIKVLKNYLKDIEGDPERNKIKIEGFRGDGFEEKVRCSRCNGKLNLSQSVAKERIDKYGIDKILCRNCSTLDQIEKSMTTYMICPKCTRILTVSKSYLDSRIANGATYTTCSICGNGKGARPVYNVPKLVDLMVEMGD